MQIATLDILEKASFTPVQAKAIIQAIEDAKTNSVSKDTFDAHRQQLATKEDLYKVKDELRQDIFRLMQWMIGLAVAQAGFTLALFKLFSPN